jgi:hypothetical protein
VATKDEPIDFSKDISPDDLTASPKRGRPPGSSTDPVKSLKSKAVRDLSASVKLLHDGAGDALSDPRIPVSDEEAKIVGEALGDLLESWGWLKYAKYAAPTAAAGRVYSIEVPRVKAVIQDLGSIRKPLGQGPRPQFNARVPQGEGAPPLPIRPGQGADPFTVADGEPLR